jgi:hypothetical protein
MTKRLSAGAMLAACAVLFTAFNAYAARPFAKEWKSKEDPYSRTSVPLFFRSSAGTTWLDVGQTCSPADTANSNHTQSEVWCFEGADGDSSWPNVGTQGSRANPLFGDPGDWGHWSRYNPPLPAPSKWHITPRNVGTGGGVYSAYCGCDSVGINPNCQEIGYWLFKEGYGNNWNYSLVLDMSGQDASSGGTIKFDALYDIECRYDYTYLEYFNSGTGQWQYVLGTALRPGIFNAVSGNDDLNHGGTGRACPGDYLFNSDQKDLGSGPELYHGNAAWETNVTFPMPVIPGGSGGLILRWRAFTDVGWSDEDGRGDTDGMFQLDNVLITFAATAVTVSDGFESGDFDSVVASSGAAQWTPGPLAGNPYDGWHLQYDPNYKNKGNTCTFSDDWMWAAKPATSGIPANGFAYILASPKVYCDGWTGGLVEWSNYMCAQEDREDYANYLMRAYDSVKGEWSLWLDFDGPGTVWFGGCDFWNFNNTELLTPYLAANVDSLQIGWELLDVNVPGDFEWGAHGAVTLLVDNVSIGEFDGTATVFTIGGTTQFSDTFSLTDQAHTQSLKNIEEGNWIATGGTRIASKDDSLQVQITDYDGVSASNVTLFWRVGTGTPPTFPGVWQSKPMILSEPDPTSESDEGTYRAAIGGPSAPEDYNVGESGSTTPPNLELHDPIWTPGQTIEYYVRVVDNRVVGGPDTRYLPSTVNSTLGSTGSAYYFEILPFNRTTGTGEKICIVDAYQRTNVIDFENSDGFSTTGGAGLGGFTAAAVSNPENLVERALVLMYGGTPNFDNTTQMYGTPKWDIYDVHGGGSSGIRHPRVVADDDIGLGGLASDIGIPRYDAVIWLTGTFDAYCYAETTRVELKTYLDNGGNLFSTGDEVAFFLGSGGQNADSTIQFLGDYLGISFPNADDDETADRTLSVEGVGGTSLAGVKLGLYGECPFRAKFDRLHEATDVVGVKTSTTLATYQSGGVDTDTDGDAAIIKNVRVAGGGVAVHCGFDISDLLSDVSRACLLDKVFTTDFGMFATSFTGCVQNGVDAPVVANSRFGFDLASASPNPFSEATSIHFSVPSRTHVSIEVYNILGQRVRTLVDETMEANSYVREWDGRADTGARVSSGIYFYKMVAGDFSATRKAVMLK